jgi:hypothetical protein
MRHLVILAAGPFLGLLILIVGTLAVAACGQKDTAAPAARPAAVPTQPIVTVAPPPDPTASAIQNDQAAEAAAKKANDQVAFYKAAAQEAADQAHAAALAEASWQTVHTQDLQKATAAQNAILATRARWVAGILFLVAIFGVIVAAEVPLFRVKAATFSAVCAGLGTVALLFAACVSYLIWIGAGIVSVGALAGIVALIRAHGSIGALTKGLEQVKADMPAIAGDIQASVAKVVSPATIAHATAVAKTIGVTLTADAKNVTKAV